VVAEQPDLTLDEIVAPMRERRIPGRRTAVWRFFALRDLTFKLPRRGATTARRGPRMSPLAVRAVSELARLVSIDESVLPRGIDSETQGALATTLKNAASVRRTVSAVG
jgi:hypothetical protein